MTLMVYTLADEVANRGSTYGGRHARSLGQSRFSYGGWNATIARRLPQIRHFHLRFPAEPRGNRRNNQGLAYGKVALIMKRPCVSSAA